MSMTQVTNFYVIVNREGTRPITCWAPAVSQTSEQDSQRTAADSENPTNAVGGLFILNLREGALSPSGFLSPPPSQREGGETENQRPFRAPLV